MTPDPHPEVVNRHPTTLVVGFGHVGQQMAAYFTFADYVDIEGVIRSAQTRCAAPHEALPVYELGFICVPTPEGPGGFCNMMAVRYAWERWGHAARYWCLKSTVEVGFTETLGENVCFSPEYYGETLGHPLVGPNRETFVILGGPPEVTRAFATAWTLVTHANTRIYQTDSRTAELCKLMENSWLATKVTFCNEFYGLAQVAGVDWHELRELWLADPRVSRSHTYVYPDNRGYGGKCLPKDTANLIAWAAREGRRALLMEAVTDVNFVMRRGR